MPKRKIAQKGAFIKAMGPHHYKGVTARGKRLAKRAKVASRRLIDRLNREYSSDNAAMALGAGLLTCTPETPCRSPACPSCAQAAQEQFTSIGHLYKRRQQAASCAKSNRRKTGRKRAPSRPSFAAVTIVTGYHASLAGHLGTPSMAQVHRWFTDQLAQAKVETAFGVLEVTLVEHEDNRYPTQWVWHFHGIVQTDDRDALAKRLRAVFSHSDMVPRPVRVVKWDGKRGWLRYCYKFYSRCRIGIDAIKRFHAGKQETRVCRGTSARRLNSDEFIELLQFLDSISLDDRIITKGAQLRSSSKGCKLVKMQRPKTVEIRDAEKEKLCSDRGKSPLIGSKKGS